MHRPLLLIALIAAALPAGVARAYDCGGLPAPVPAADALARVRAEANRILESASCDGPIALTPERTVVVPYTANLAALGLARAHAVTGDERYAHAAWRWLDWYQRRQDPLTGYITNHVADGPAWRSTGEIDATDSAAATFLIALAETVRATGDAAHLKALAPAVRRSLRAIASTTDADGMTYALPGSDWKYTMDQAEVYAGLRAAAALAATASDVLSAAEATQAAARLAASAERLWDDREGLYDWGLSRSGARGQTAIEHWYPSATAQPWTIVFDLAPPSRWRGIIERFDASHPDWFQPAILKANDGGTSAPAGYWPLIALAYARAGDPERAAQGAEAIRLYASGENHIFPFTPAVAAGLILVESDPAVLAFRSA